jgi:hypothetical protein
MNPIKLILHCYAEYKNGQWNVYCLDFTLAAQADTFSEAKAKIEAMIYEYVYDATVGEHKDYADQLLNRRAPLTEWLKYYLLVFRFKFTHTKRGIYHLFTESIPLAPIQYKRF